MPAAKQYLNPNDNQRLSLLNDEAREIRERQQAYEKNLKFYLGDQPAQLDTPTGEPDDNTIINITRMALDRMVSFLFPAVPTFELDTNTTSETEDERWLRQAWDANGGLAFLHKLALNAGLSGHAYVRIRRPSSNQPHQFPQLINLNPTQMVTYWQADDMDSVLWHTLRWTGHRKEEHLLDTIWFPEQQVWQEHEWMRVPGTGWRFVALDDWPFPGGPVVEWQHLINPGDFYGLAEGDRKLQEKINLVASELARIVRHFAAPKTIATGVAPDDIQETAIGDLWSTENPEAKIANLEMKSDLKASHELLQFFFDSYLNTVRTVILRGEVKDFQRVTNAGVRTVFLDMLSKNNLLRFVHGNGLQQISNRMSAIAGRGATIVPEVMHADPLPTDDTERVNVAALEHSMNIVSRETLSTKRGYHWADELNKMQAEAELEIFQNEQETALPEPTDPSVDSDV